MIKMSETIVELLHEKRKITQKNADKVWGKICAHTDGVDIEAIREEFGLLNKPSDRLRRASTLQWQSKSKLNSFLWDTKQFFWGTIVGLGTVENIAMRAGSNAHLVSEKIPKYIFDEDIGGKEDILPIVWEMAKKTFAIVVGNAANACVDFEDALLYFEEEEAAIYRNSMYTIAQDYQRRYAYLKSMYISREDMLKYLLPKWTEIVIWDYVNWRRGIVDAIFKVPYGNYLPVDYKFGSPKVKYYTSGIGLEMTYYKHLLQAQGADCADSFFGKRRPWTPIYCEKGEMWYVRDQEGGVNDIKFSPKWDRDFYLASDRYWEALNNMDYRYQKHYAFNMDRYTNFCLDCDLLKLCKRTITFRFENDPAFKGIFGE